MYAWMWKKLPGPWPVKTLESLVLLFGITALLFIVVFPRLDSSLPFNQVTVDDNTSQTPVGVPATTPAPGLAGQ